MKILMISMFAPHFYNWTEQLKYSGHEIHWIDVFDSNTHVDKIDFVHQIIGWRNRWDYPGRYKIKNKFPGIYKFINIFNQKDLARYVEKKIEEIKPDIVHSFVLQSAGYPLIDVMEKNPTVKWVYSAWGNDLFYRQQNEKDLKKIKQTLPHFDFMFADCKRDYFIAKNHGFTGEFMGVFPTGGGYDISNYNKWIKPSNLKKTILIKGYEGNLGRCNKVLKAIIPLKEKLALYEIVVFGANPGVKKFVTNSSLIEWSNFKVLTNIPHENVLKLMGESLLYIGNSISDGMPNTLLEALIMGVFPIQSNPGGATAEIIEDGKNGLLIKNPEDSEEILNLISAALSNPVKIKKGIAYNFDEVRPRLEREYLRKQVLSKYDLIENSLKGYNDSY